MDSPKSSYSPPAALTFTHTPDSIVLEAKRAIEICRSAQDQIVASVQLEDAAFATVVVPLAHAKNELDLQANTLKFFLKVSPDAAIREASREAASLFDVFSVECKMREDLFRLINIASRQNENLDCESRRLIEAEHRDYVQNGLNIPLGPKRDRFRDIKKRIGHLAREFQKNMAEDTSGIWFTPQELEGVPEDVVSSLEKGTGINEGKLKLTFDYPSLFPTLRYAENGETRRRYYIAHENMFSQNVPIFKEVVLLRHEAANLLGYPNHAALRLEDKMAKSPAAVNAFLDDMFLKLEAGGIADIERLKQVRKEHLQSRNEHFDGRFYIWDHGFYNRMMLEKEHSVEQQKISEYFPLGSTIARMLSIFEHLFGLKFNEIVGDSMPSPVSGSGQNLVWHEDVRLFAVWDDAEGDRTFLGYLYMDLFPRTGKYGHMCNINLQPVSRYIWWCSMRLTSLQGFLREDGSRQHPTTALICNFTKPTQSKPSLLKHDEVWQLFHELGHGIHDIVAKTIHSRFHGTACVDDFCEAPSQMLENWCWEPSRLKELSFHYSLLSPEYAKFWEQQAENKTKPLPQLPDDMAENLVKSKLVNGALFELRQLHRSYFDMRVHEATSYEDLEKLDISALFNRLQKQISHLDAPEDDLWGHGQASFAHLMGSYDVGYYGYL